jgi:hypothetical protein
MFFTICSLSMILCYIVNIFCGTKMVAFVQSHADFNPRMKELNRQVTKNLIILVMDFLINIFIDRIFLKLFLGNFPVFVWLLFSFVYPNVLPCSWHICASAVFLQHYGPLDHYNQPNCHHLDQSAL